MDKEHKVLIVGAGPSGMVCALSLVQQGIPVRIIEKRNDRGGISKATGVSLGTIQALYGLGISQKITESMAKMSRFVFYEDDNLVSNLHIPLLNGKPPAYLFPQLKLERIIEEKLNSEGCLVEYDTSIENINNDNSQFSLVRIKLPSGETQEGKFEWVVGADGAHSTVRENVGFDFEGKTYPEEWSVSEIETDEWNSEIQAKLFLGSDGVGLFLSNPEPGIIQGILNGPDVGSRLLEKFPNAKANYERKFRVYLKRVVTPRINRVWLIGDAAHVQSPIGGQGLNLAIADAVILSNWLYSNPAYAERRLSSQAKRTLFFTDFDYKMLATRNTAVRVLRNLYWASASKVPAISRWFFWSISGVKHYKGTESA